MRTVLADVLSLASETFSLWRRNFLPLGMWFCIGFGLHQLGVQLSARIGAHSQVLATLSFIFGVLAWLVALILMTAVLKPALVSPGRVADISGIGTRVPESIFRPERPLDVLILTVGPFLAVYSVWGFVQDEVSDLFFANLAQSSYDLDFWSVSFAPNRAPFYAVLTVVAWAVAKIGGLLRKRPGIDPDLVDQEKLDQVRTARRIRSGQLLSAVVVIADAAFVFGFFLIITILANLFKDWWRGRALALWLTQLRDAVLGALPSWQLWGGRTLPAAVGQALDWVWQTLLPGMADRLLLPLLWLALTAMVFGWREFRGRDLVSRPGLQRVADQMADRVPQGALATAIRFATEDLRMKYVPVITALRMLARAGAAFVGAYLVLATVLWSAQQWFGRLLTVLPGPPPDVGIAFLEEPFQDLITGLLFTTAAVALYAAAFDRAMAAVTDVRSPAPSSAVPVSG